MLPCAHRENALTSRVMQWRTHEIPCYWSLVTHTKFMYVSQTHSPEPTRQNTKPIYSWNTSNHSALANSYMKYVECLVHLNIVSNMKGWLWIHRYLSTVKWNRRKPRVTVPSGSTVQASSSGLSEEDTTAFVSFGKTCQEHEMVPPGVMWTQSVSSLQGPYVSYYDLIF